MLYNYNDVDQILDRLYLGNIKAATNLPLLKRLVFYILNQFRVLLMC